MKWKKDNENEIKKSKKNGEGQNEISERKKNKCKNTKMEVKMKNKREVSEYYISASCCTLKFYR
jgi:hypothetical protein